MTIQLPELRQQAQIHWIFLQQSFEAGSGCLLFAQLAWIYYSISFSIISVEISYLFKPFNCFALSILGRT